MSRARMAKEALKILFGQNASGLDIGLRVAPDLAFGALEAYMTPGDLADKAVAGFGSATGGIGGGVLLSKFAGNNQAVGNILDMVGSIGGDFAGRAGAEQIQRGKDSLLGGKGQTPYERLSDEQIEQLKQQVQMQTLADLGMLPGSAQQYLTDGMA